MREERVEAEFATLAGTWDAPTIPLSDEEELLARIDAAEGKSDAEDTRPAA